jgi:hypothetical protein
VLIGAEHLNLKEVYMDHAPQSRRAAAAVRRLTRTREEI